jgi:hypothetical protein
MKSLSRVREFFSRKDHALSLKLRVASALNVFVSIRGLEALLNSGTAVVMRQGYETLDMECYDRLLTIKTNHCFHRGKLNRTISNDLADEMAKQLLKKAGKIDNGKRRMISKALEFYQS